VAEPCQPSAIPPAAATPPGWGPPPGPLPPGPPRPPRNDQAILALILGIEGPGAFVGARLGLLFVFNLPPAIAAWIVGVDARRRIARGETSERASAARAGVVLGVAGTLLGALAIVGWALALALSPDRRGLVVRILGG
jgi:hypothetical protein